jgi:Asp-tRNA(Asn)/Glu-tRNA(Gln) amidotransferase A subunit family amidase
VAGRDEPLPTRVPRVLAVPRHGPAGARRRDLQAGPRCRHVAPTRAPDTRTTDHARQGVVYGPDLFIRRAWPTFNRDARAALTAAGVSTEAPHGLPSVAAAARAFDGYLCAHFGDFIGKDELSLRDGVSAALLGLATRGRLDKRLHPKGAALFSLVALGRATLFRDRVVAAKKLEAARAPFRRVWERGTLIVTPTTTVPASRHGGTALDFRLLSFVKIGNLTDATALALPFGRFADGLPRSLQILGPPGSEDAVLDLAERLERVAPR